MNPEIKREWVKALRSGDYQQGRGHLHTISDEHGEQFCVLGVLGQVLENRDLLNGCTVDSETTPSGRKYIGYRMPGAAGMTDAIIPWQMLEAAGIDAAVWEPVNSLWSMNDSGASFPFLADHIERLAAL